MATAYSRPIPKKPWKAPVIRELDGAEAECALQIMVERGLFTPQKSE
jgi:hypothetical protein